MENPPRSPLRLIGGLLCLAGAAAGVAWVFHLASPEEILIDIELRGESGRIERLPYPSQRNFPVLANGERLRLEVKLARPAALLAYLEDGKGALTDLYPPSGPVPLVAAGTAVLPDWPGAERFWDTSEVEPGLYLLWVLVAGEPLSEEKRARIRDRLAEAREGGTARVRRDFVEEVMDPVRDALRREVAEECVWGFFLHPRKANEERR